MDLENGTTQAAIDIKVLKDLKRPLLTMEIAGDRPPRYDEKNAVPHRRARACPSPCFGAPRPRGGQAPALRYAGPPPFHRRALACPSPSCVEAQSNNRGGQARALRKNRDREVSPTERIEI